ncbi:MAG: nucleotidyltransferase domain-containing protein [Chloroflexi bacterium]|nr:nucleotidyltransferase domain-containing protein [Chloroflexota bacterium]
MVKGQNRIKAMIQRYVNELAREIQVEKVILYGSHARGDYFEESDIDLIVISSDFELINPLERLEFLALRWRMPKAAEILGYTPAEFQTLLQGFSIVSEAIKEGQTVYEMGAQQRR